MAWIVFWIATTELSRFSLTIFGASARSSHADSCLADVKLHKTNPIPIPSILSLYRSFPYLLSNLLLPFLNWGSKTLPMIDMIWVQQGLVPWHHVIFCFFSNSFSFLSRSECWCDVFRGLSFMIPISLSQVLKECLKGLKESSLLCMQSWDRFFHMLCLRFISSWFHLPSFCFQSVL